MTKRTSPLNMGLEPDKVVEWNGWTVGLTYFGEFVHNTVFITDLSHLSKWNVQGHDIDDVDVQGLRFPKKPRYVVMDENMAAVRLTPWEAFIMNFSHSYPEPKGMGLTNVTEALAAFAVVGHGCLEILEKLSDVDLSAPGTPMLQAAQTPVAGITCLVMCVRREGKIPGLIVSGPRGYGQFLLEAFLDAGKEYGIAVAGWERFHAWYAK